MYYCDEILFLQGGLFELSGGHVCKLRWQRTKGALLREPGKDMSPEDIRDHWEVVTNWENSEIIKVIFLPIFFKLLNPLI